jgi:hypothetical protein
MDNLKGDQLVVRRVTSSNEEERGIAAVYNLGVCCLSEDWPDTWIDMPTFVFQEVAHTSAASENKL